MRGTGVGVSITGCRRGRLCREVFGARGTRPPGSAAHPAVRRRESAKILDHIPAGGCIVRVLPSRGAPPTARRWPPPTQPMRAGWLHAPCPAPCAGPGLPWHGARHGRMRCCRTRDSGRAKQQNPRRTGLDIQRLHQTLVIGTGTERGIKTPVDAVGQQRDGGASVEGVLEQLPVTIRLADLLQVVVGRRSMMQRGLRPETQGQVDPPRRRLELQREFVADLVGIEDIPAECMQNPCTIWVRRLSRSGTRSWRFRPGSVSRRSRDSTTASELPCSVANGASSAQALGVGCQRSAGSRCCRFNEAQSAAVQSHTLLQDSSSAVYVPDDGRHSRSTAQPMSTRSPRRRRGRLLLDLDAVRAARRREPAAHRSTAGAAGLPDGRPSGRVKCTSPAASSDAEPLLVTAR